MEFRVFACFRVVLDSPCRRQFLSFRPRVDSFDPKCWLLSVFVARSGQDLVVFVGLWRRLSVRRARTCAHERLDAVILEMPIVLTSHFSRHFRLSANPWCAAGVRCGADFMSLCLVFVERTTCVAAVGTGRHSLGPILHKQSRCTQDPRALPRRSRSALLVVACTRVYLVWRLGRSALCVCVCVCVCVCANPFAWAKGPGSCGRLAGMANNISQAAGLLHSIGLKAPASATDLLEERRKRPGNLVPKAFPRAVDLRPVAAAQAPPARSRGPAPPPQQSDWRHNAGWNVERRPQDDGWQSDWRHDAGWHVEGRPQDDVCPYTPRNQVPDSPGRRGKGIEKSLRAEE